MIARDKELNIIKTFEENFRGAKTLHDTKVDEITKWKDVYEGQKYGNENDGQSQLVWKLVKKQLESLIPNVAKPFIGSYELVDLVPLTKNDAHKASIYKKLANHFFSKGFNSDAFIKDMVRVAGKHGTCFVRVGWDRNIKEKKMVVPRIDERVQAIAKETNAEIIQNPDGTYTLVKKTINVNRPSAKIIRTENIYVDPTADTFKESAFVIHEYVTTLSKLREESILYDADSLKKLEEHVQEFTDINRGTEISLYNETAFSFSDDTRRKIRIYEYFGEYDLNEDGINEQVVMVLARPSGNASDDVVLSITDNPFPFKSPPIIAIPLFKDEFSIYGKPLASLIEDEQKLMTSIIRGIIDNMANSNNGVKFIRKGALDAVNANNLINGGKYIEVKSNEPIQSVIMDGNFNELPSSVYNLFSLIDQHAESMTGINKFMQGLASSEMKASSSNFSAVMSQSQIRLLDIVNNISNGLKDIITMWIEMSMAYLDNHEISKITGIDIQDLKMRETHRLIKEFNIEELPQDVQQQAVMLIMTEVDDMFDKEDFKFDVKISVGTDSMKDIKINQLNMFMQQAAQLVSAGAVPADIVKELVAELAELLDKPNIADKIRKYEPQPDPMQQAMAEAEVAQARAKAGKEEALAKNALARTELTMVKAKGDMASLEADVANKYADVYSKIKPDPKENNNE